MTTHGGARRIGGLRYFLPRAPDEIDVEASADGPTSLCGLDLSHRRYEELKPMSVFAGCLCDACRAERLRRTRAKRAAG